MVLCGLFPGSSAAEQAAVNRPVGGSNPSWGAKFSEAIMGIAIPIIATAAAWPVVATARVGLASLIGLYCGATRADNRLISARARPSSAEIALFLVGAVWAAWGLAHLV